MMKDIRAEWTGSVDLGLTSAMQWGWSDQAGMAGLPEIHDPPPPRMWWGGVRDPGLREALNLHARLNRSPYGCPWQLVSVVRVMNRG